MQVKGVMPPKGGLTRQTPTGRAVGEVGVWHNFFRNSQNSYAIFYEFPGLESKKSRNLYVFHKSCIREGADWQVKKKEK